MEVAEAGVEMEAMAEGEAGSCERRCSSSSSSSSFSNSSFSLMTLHTPTEARSEKNNGAATEEASGSSGGNGYGGRAASVNVVAQLMGLEKLPPTMSSHCSRNPSFDLASHRNPAIAKNSQRTVEAVPDCRSLSLRKNAEHRSSIDSALCRNAAVHNSIRSERNGGRNSGAMAQNNAKRIAGDDDGGDGGGGVVCRNHGGGIVVFPADTNIIPERITDIALFKNPSEVTKNPERTTVAASIEENGAPSMASPRRFSRQHHYSPAAFPPLRAHNSTLAILPPIRTVKVGFTDKIPVPDPQPCIGNLRTPFDGASKGPHHHHHRNANDRKPAPLRHKDPQTKVNVLVHPRSDLDLAKLQVPGNLLHKNPVKTTRLLLEDKRNVGGRFRDGICKKQSMISVSKKSENAMMQLRNFKLEGVDNDLQSDASSCPPPLSGSGHPSPRYHTKHYICSSGGKRTKDAPGRVAEPRQESTSMPLLGMREAPRKQAMGKRKESKDLRQGLNIQRPNKPKYVESLPDFMKANGERCTSRSHPNSILVVDRRDPKKSMDSASCLDHSLMLKHGPGSIVPEDKRIIQHDKLLLNRDMREKWIPCVFEEGLNRTYDLRISQDALEFSYDSSNADLSSPDEPCTPEKKPNSGKSTMMVLQELLLALKPSKECVKQEEDLQKSGPNALGLTIMKSSLESEDCRDVREKNRRNSDIDIHHQTQGNANRLQDRAKKYVYKKGSKDGSHAGSVSTIVHHIREDSSTCLGSFTFTEGIEDNGCESFRCTSIISTERNRNNVQFTLNKGAKVIISSDQDYVNCILNSLRICTSDFHSARMQLSHPVADPSLFNQLEELVEDKSDWKTTVSQNNISFPEVAKLNRRLIFDCVLEVLGSYARNERELQLSFALSLQDSLTILTGNVMRQIEGWQSINSWLDVDEMLLKAMNTSFGKWNESLCEPHVTVMEVIDIMIKDLLQELLFELGSYS